MSLGYLARLHTLTAEVGMDLDQPKRERLRFEEFDHHTSQNGRTRVHVVLMLGEDRFTG